MPKTQIVPYLLMLAGLVVTPICSSAPGDILFQEQFNNNGDFVSDWTSNGLGSAGVSNQTFNSGPNALYLSGSNEQVTSDSGLIAANVPAAELTLWIRRGADSFSENPDAGEDLRIGYLNTSNTWIELATYPGGGTPGEIINATFNLPADALYNNLRLKFGVLGGTNNFDYWHIDDVVVTERAVGAITGLIGEWHFDELFWNGTNSEVTDSSGNGLNLTAFSAQTSDANPAIAGDPGTCAYGIFNGSVSFIQRDDDTTTADSLLDIPDTLTITTWIYTNVIPTGGNIKSILSKDENYEFHLDSNGEIYWWWGWNNFRTVGANITPGTWHHVALTWRSGEQIIYVDGINRGQRNFTGTLTLNNDPLQVGQDLNIPSRFWDGYIDEVRIYENYLSAAQINQIMNETHPCIASGVCVVTFEDNFPAAAYNNSTGSDPWGSDWLERNDDGTATGGDIVITGGQLRMDNHVNGGAPAIEREMNLAGYLTAFINVDFATSGTLENGDRFDVAVSDNGGASYSIVGAFANDFSGNFNYDLSAYMTANTRIRFRIENGYRSNNEWIDIDNVVITGQKFCGPDHFVLLHDGAGINCLPELITLRAEDSNGNLVTDYTGTVDLSLSTTHGNWNTVDSSGTSSDPALGTLTDTAGDNNGAATYQFNATDGGTVALYLEDTVAETANIGVADGAIVDDNTEGDITFRPYGFVFTPDPVDTQVAGKPFNVTLTAAGQTPSQPECGVIEEYTGVKSLNLWSSYANPITSPTQVSVNSTAIATNEAASAAQNITFTNGVTALSAQYDDVGQISLHAKDEAGIGEPPAGNVDEIIGGISPFVVRPFGYDIQIAGNPWVNDGNGTVFSTAGGTFAMTIRSVLWQSADDQLINASSLPGSDGIPDPFIDTNGDAIPDSGGDLSDNGVTPNISQISGNIGLAATALVVTVNNGTLSTNSANFTSFPSPVDVNAGSVTIAAQSWDEVGILQINANTIDFMGVVGENVTGERINIGRFIPDHFNLAAPTILEQCGSFTYGGFFDGVNALLDRNGQTFSFSNTISAENFAGNVTQNYQGVFGKLTSADFTVQPYNVSTAANATGRINSTVNLPAFSAGTTTYDFTNVDYQFDLLTAPFDLRLDISAVDSDGASSGIVNSNALQVRIGRMVLIDSYGPELGDLEMRLKTEYFNGTAWVLNTDDSCSTYIQTNASFDPASYTENLNAGETTLFSPASSQTLVSGVSSLANGIWFTAPGENNYGSVRINLDLSGQGWLQFDWDGDNTLDTTTGTLNFGYYRGSDRVIYWREIKN